jgi:hypothetical protein
MRDLSLKSEELARQAVASLGLKCLRHDRAQVPLQCCRLSMIMSLANANISRR